MATPTMMFGYDDRFLLPMLEARQKQLEDHGLMGLARQVSKQIREVREWQVTHPHDLCIASAVTARPDPQVQ